MRLPRTTLPRTTLSLAASGPADPDVAWRRYAELDRWPDWSPQVRGVEASGRTLVPGLSGHVLGPAGLRVAFTVESVGDRVWTWVVHPLPGASVRLHHAVLARGTGCTTTLVLSGPAPLVLPYAPVARLALGRLVRT